MDFLFYFRLEFSGKIEGYCRLISLVYIIGKDVEESFRKMVVVF